MNQHAILAYRCVDLQPKTRGKLLRVTYYTLAGKLARRDLFL